MTSFSEILTKINPSQKVLNTHNIIEDVFTYQAKAKKNPNKKILALSIGDPTVFGNLEYPPNIKDNLKNIIDSDKFNGYGHSAGFEPAREAVAKRMSNSKHTYTKEDVFLTYGGSGAVDMAIDYLASAGDNILVPKPGFPLYETLCGSKDVKVKEYTLIGEKNWEIDLNELRTLIDDRTKGIIITNPSNPCGSNFTKQHVLDIIQVAREKSIPIIADEVYDKFTFHGEMHRVSELAEDLPVFTIGSVSKIFIVPGWRCGWLHIHDPKNVMPNVREGMEKLTQLTLGPCTLVQAMIPHLMQTPESYYEKINEILRKNTDKIEELSSELNGMRIASKPQGSFFVMMKIEIEKFTPESGIKNDWDFMSKLLEEESVKVIPGVAFQMPNHVRITTCGSLDAITEAFKRLKEFCDRHTKQN